MSWLSLPPRIYLWLKSLQATVVPASVIAGTTLVFLICATVIWNIFGNHPPVRLVSLDPEELGPFCPGDSAPVHMLVTVDADAMLVYYISVLDEEGDSNYIGYQKAFPDIQHPHPASVIKSFPWTVPDLPPGRYTRGFAARTLEGRYRTVFVPATFQIRSNCL